MMGNGWRWSVGVLTKLVFDITQNIEKQIVEPEVASLAIDIVFKANQRFIRPQNCQLLMNMHKAFTFL